ncbi:MAG: hybrid sensor histidine kinase/response regulator [Chloroflexota bacterium]
MDELSLVELFREDADIQLDLLSEGIVEAERADAPMEALGICMRAAHSLKGAARVIGLDPVVRLAHAMEEAFQAARDGRIRLGGDDVDRLLAAVDLVRRLSRVEEADLDAFLAAEDATFTTLVEQLTATGQGRPTAPAPAPVPSAGPVQAPEPDPVPSTPTEPTSTARASTPDPAPVTPTRSTPTPAPGPSTPTAPATTNRSTPTPSSPTPAGLGWAARTAAAPAPVPAPPPATPSTPAPAPPAPVPQPAAPTPDAARQLNAIKVTPEAIGRLMALSAEVAVELRQLERHVETLTGIGRSLDGLVAAGRSDPAANAGPALEALARSFAAVRSDLEQLAADARRAADDLHHDVLATRLRPFSDITGGLPRLVRDVARQLGKEVRLVLRGAETAVDRDILAALEAPLGHLVRNAIDHALETPEERDALGKAPEGRLVVAASHRAGSLVIHVEDDGRGIDAEGVRARAVTAGLVTPAMAADLRPDEVLEFLFLPGFSTASAVTDVSGRGVGLDVVQAVVHAAGGSVRVSTVPGEGTTFSLHLPVTRSVLRCLLVTIAGEPFALPLSHVDRLLRIAPEDLVTVEGRACVRVDDETVGLVPAAEVLEMGEGATAAGPIHIVVLADRGRRHGLEVEGFTGERDLVVRPLDPRLGTVPDVLAASLLDDGTPIVILDPDDLVRSIDEDLGGGRLRRLPRLAPVAAPVTRCILVVDDSLTVREVERQLLEAQGYRVETAVDGAAGWNALRLGEHDLLLTDVDMPRMTGIELTRRVRADPRLARLPVIIVSYKDREEDRLAGLDAGADRYLTKSSFTDDSLITAVADLLTRAGR